MTPEDFVRCFSKEKQSLLEAYLNPESGSLAAQKIKSLGLDPEQLQQMESIVDDILTDTFYTLLLGLDGAAAIGGRQMMYRLYDEEGNELTGELEGYAWEHFHGR